MLESPMLKLDYPCSEAYDSWLSSSLPQQSEIPASSALSQSVADTDSQH